MLVFCPPALPLPAARRLPSVHTSDSNFLFFGSESRISQPSAAPNDPRSNPSRAPISQVEPNLKASPSTCSVGHRVVVPRLNALRIPDFVRPRLLRHVILRLGLPALETDHHVGLPNDGGEIPSLVPTPRPNKENRHRFLVEYMTRRLRGVENPDHPAENDPLLEVTPVVRGGTLRDSSHNGMFFVQIFPNWYVLYPGFPKWYVLCPDFPIMVCSLSRFFQNGMFFVQLFS